VPVHERAAGGRCGTPGRQRLLIRAVAHAQLLEHCRVHEVREALPADIRHQVLNHDIAVAGIVPLRTGLAAHAHRRIGSRRQAIEDLRQGRQRFANRIAREKIAARESAGMAQQELWRWVYVLSGTFQDVSRRFTSFVELELALLHQIKGAHRRYWFTDGAGQEKCRGYHWCRSALCVTPYPFAQTIRKFSMRARLMPGIFCCRMSPLISRARSARFRRCVSGQASWPPEPADDAAGAAREKRLATTIKKKMTRRFDAARFKRKTIRDRFTVSPS
jgi:hypothetical protein